MHHGRASAAVVAAGGREQCTTRRASIGAVVLAAHAGVLAYLVAATSSSPARHSAPPDAWLTWLEVAAAPEAAAMNPTNKSAAAQPERVARPSFAPPGPKPPLATDPTPAPAIDWRSEVGASAARVLEAERLSRRQARAFDPQRTPGLAEPPATPRAPPHFRWSEAHTKRLTRDANGNTILRLNERCVIVNFVLPACAIGEIPTYGDLFEDMNRAAEFGDWNDDSATRRDNMPP